MSDFRSERMPSLEGQGRARAAWEAYSRAARAVADVTPLGDALCSVSVNQVGDLMGFWVLWHVYGGFEGLQAQGMSRSSIYRKTTVFRKVFGKHPDEYEFPGITIDVDQVLNASADDTKD